MKENWANEATIRHHGIGGVMHPNGQRLQRPLAERKHMLPVKANGENDLDLTCINTIRTLSMDAVQAANSGHPGTPMAPGAGGLLPVAGLSAFDPQDPIWPNRDHFILSTGHASMLLYSLLDLTGVKAVSKDYETLGEGILQC